MAITTLQVITDALRSINVISEVDTPSSEQGEAARRILNQMMEVWREDGIDIGWFAQANTTGDAPIPDWSESAVISSLALRLAPRFGASISQELAATGSQDYRMVLQKVQREALDNTDMSHLPQGSGHDGWNKYNINTDS